MRLTGSGLGCPDWPSCFQHHLTAVSSFHPIVEFANRLVSAAVTLVSVAALAVAALRTPPRRDLTLLGAGLVAGIAAQIVLGGLVVLFKLNPYLVALHFLLTIVILADAIVLYHLSGSRATRAEPVVGRDLVRLARLQLSTLTLVTVLGTVVTGAGPHAGGPGAKRIPIAFRDIAEVHSTVALFLIGMTLASQFAFHHANAPAGRAAPRTSVHRGDGAPRSARLPAVLPARRCMGGGAPPGRGDDALDHGDRFLSVVASASSRSDRRCSLDWARRRRRSRHLTRP